MTPTMTINSNAKSVSTSSFEVIVNSAMIDTVAPERDLALWHQSVGLARQACARIFRDGGRPADAIRAFGLAAEVTDWRKAVTLIAETLCTPAMQRAA